MTDLKKSILACIEQLDVSSASLAKAISIIESQAIQIAELEAACATAEQSKDKWVAIVRATNKGYAMELSKYIAYALPEGTHELYAAPQAPQSRDSVIEECAKVCDAMANEVADQRQFALDLCSDAIRALKSQQRGNHGARNAAIEECSAICQRHAANALSNPAIHADSPTAAHAVLVCAAVEIVGLKLDQRSGNGESS